MQLLGMLIVTLMSIGLCACAVGPDFHPLPPPKTARYTRLPMPRKTASLRAFGQAGKAQYFVMRQKIPATWWKLFHSTKLNRLINTGLKNNQTLAKAKATLQKSQQTLREAIGALLVPAIDLNAGVQRNRVASVQYGVPIPPNVFNLYTLGGKLSYELDVFGGRRREVETYRAEVDYERYELMAAYITLTSNITTTFVDIASLEAQIREMHALIQAESNILRIVQRQLGVGGASKKAVLAQQTLLAQTKAKLPPLQKTLSEFKHTMAVLLGKPTSKAPALYFKLAAIHLPAKLPVSLPSTWINQRPDIQAAQALLHVASAKIGVATAELLPKVTLDGSYGWLSPLISRLFTPTSVIWDYGAALLQPIMRGGALIAKRRAALAAYQEALAQYQQTLLQAFKDVSDVLRAIEADAKEFRAQALAEQGAKQTLAIVQQQFKVGGENYLSVLNAEKQYEETRIRRIEAQAARYMDTAALFQALGGGWWNSPWVHKQGLRQ